MTDQEDRRKEEAYLNTCIQVIRRNIESYEKEIRIMDAEIEDMYDRYRHDDPEIFTELSNTITMNNNMKTALHKNRKALKKPYFGRIDVKEQGREPETFYIGKGGVTDGPTTILVVDWRAPIANVYYENGLGECVFQVPDHTVCRVELRRKRTYEIEGDRLIDYYDSEVVANDELLTKYLAKNKEAVLGEIIATIQKEQNEIIRKSPYRNIIVQGVAGSGKTTVAMHRISYILYNYTEDFKPDDFYIVGSNRILLNYITGVLPDLDVYGIRQMTMEELFVRLLYEDWNEKKYRIIPCGENGGNRGTGKWFAKLENYCKRLEKDTIPAEDIRFEDKVLYSSEQIREYIANHPSISIQGKIDALNLRVLTRLKNEITGRDLTYDREERRRLIKEYTGRFGGKKWKRSIYSLYEEFLAEEGMAPETGRRGMTQFDVYDLAALAYLYKRVKETDPIREAHHIVVDEAQDYGMMAYSALRFCIPQCSWTIMGDVSQNIRFGFGLNDWEELKELMLTDPKDSFAVLSKSYRNTMEISAFAQRILKAASFRRYPIEPIIRHGNEVHVSECGTEEEMTTQAVSLLSSWQEAGYETIAVILRNEAEAKEIAARLGEQIAVEESDPGKAAFGKGILVLPAEYTKGLEFDAVLIYNPTQEDYPEDDGHAKLLYVAATRALHELAVVYAGSLTGLLRKE